MNKTTNRVVSTLLLGSGGFILLLLFLILPGFLWAKTTPSTVKVEINYGEVKEASTIDVPWESGMTVLDALMHVSNVSTHPVGSYVFVVAIDSVEGKRGVMAWYYEVNGKHPKELAITNKVKAGDTITWLYTKDVCSATVDGKK